MKQLRKDVRNAIIIIKSRKEAKKLPRLTFFKYKVKQEDTFWTILSRCSMNIDTLLTLNDLSSPRDVYPGKTIFIPNMRGIVVEAETNTTVDTLAKTYNVHPDYITHINGRITEHHKYIFIPCGKLKKLQRSLFLGRGFIYPLKHVRYTSDFGTRRNPFNRHKLSFHAGIDLACRTGTNVHATRGGTVIFSGYKGGYGKLVIIRHEHGYTSYYGHLSRQLVKKGQKVNSGQVIALSGNTGRTTGPHLHFEIRKWSKPVNPNRLVRGHK